MEQVYYEGECLCGSVNLKVKPKSKEFIVCHCKTCQTWNGGPQFAVPCGKDIEIKGEDKISEFASSPWAVRGFCSKCGTHLYYKLNESGECNVMLGVLNIHKEEELRLSVQYFIDLKPSYYSLDSTSPTLTEKEILKMFS